ncbi:pseudouridine synthase [Desulfovibrio oxyclinae]|jgi:23S rRNA pseudouridine2605 synthase|uniref:pseudouridine synthase n=1 Tax=Desulfovibrio oxyclinae TaxID=63560 RepID=UPI000368C56A|nr:pseudouridine synthase [Desulfovibrio oxyclinae]
MSESNDPIRLNKYLAMNGIASRRGADDLVFSGRVSVNGEVAESPGVKVTPGSDKVLVDGKPVGTPPESNVTIMLNKPTRVVTTASDPQGRKTVMDLLPNDIKAKRPFPVGRLDFFSEGLLLLTTDGDLCHRLTHPRYHLPKDYAVTVRGLIPGDAIKTMESGMTLEEGEKLAPVKISVKPPKDGKQMMIMTLHQGINRQIRRMCRDLDLTILRLKRVRQGPLEIGRLPVGKWKYIDGAELKELRAAVGLNS